VAPPPTTIANQPVLRPWLRAQALNVGRHAAALRDFRRDEFGTGPESPTEGHIRAVNQVLTRLRAPLMRRTEQLSKLVTAATERPEAPRLIAVVTHKTRSHDWVRRIERIWDFYLELFGQRQSIFGTWLLGADRIALDCYQDAYMGLGTAKSVPAPPPFNYMRTGFGPATYRRGIQLRQLAQELNPFPLIQLPYHRLVNPWTLGAILHEVSHNLQSDLGLSRVVPLSIGRHLLRGGIPRRIAQIWVRWNREIFADLSGLLLGGPAVVASLMDVVGLSPAIAMNFNPSGVHPVPYLRVLLSIELLRRMGFEPEAQRHARSWNAIYARSASGLPAELLRTAGKCIELVVEAVCYQRFRTLGNRSMSQLYCCGQKEQRMIEEAAQRMSQGNDPGIVPERFLIGAARFALDNRLATADVIRDNFFRELARR
jgi:hypothetical protein